MRLSRYYQYQILCEDVQMRTFIQSVLIHQGINARRIRISNYPCGEGCGEAFVRREFVREYKIIKSTNYLRKVLIVCTDADNFEVAERMKVLKQELENNQIKWEGVKEPIILWIPKRQIETWISALKGEAVDEEMTFRHTGKPLPCKEEAKSFSLFCQGIKDVECRNVESLQIAKEEYIRVCQLQQK